MRRRSGNGSRKKTKGTLRRKKNEYNLNFVRFFQQKFCEIKEKV